MNIKEMEAARDAALKEAKSIVKSNAEEMSDADFERVTELKVKVDNLDAQIGKAQARRDVVSAITASKAAVEDEVAARGEMSSRTIGGHFIKSAETQLKNFRSGDRYSIQGTEFKAASDPAKVSGQAQGVVDGYAAEYSRDIVNQRRERLVAADVMGSARVSGAVIKYLVEKVQRIAEGGFTTVAEGGKKPYISYSPLDLVQETPSKVAALAKISDEMLEDLPFLTDYINNQLVYDLSVAEENQLLKGDGQGSNLKGLFHREGIQTLDIGTGDPFDGLLEAVQLVAEATPLTADAVLLNPADFTTLRKAKDGNKQYLAGGPFQGQYGQGGIMIDPPIWGLNVVSTPAVDKGTYMVGAFRQGAIVLRKGGVRIDSTNTNVDDFENNLSTLRAEERLGLMVPRPAAFVTGTINGGTAAVPTAPTESGDAA